MNWNAIGDLLGRFLIFIAGTMFLPVLVALYFAEPAAKGFLISALITSAAGLIICKTARKTKSLTFRDGCALVSLVWLSAAFFGALPFMFSGVTSSFIDAIFESMSGFTTTGASVIANMEYTPQSILFWRSLSQWLGGMGIIVLYISVLPSVSTVAINLFRAEVPGPIPEKIKPRIQDNARIMWLIYISITGLAIVLLMIFGMPFFEAINHALATVATGGFSYKSDSVSSYSPAIQYIIGILIIVSGVNFSLYYFALKNGIKTLYKDDEFRFYLLIIAVATVVITINILPTYLSLESSFRHAFFQVGSIITTTGFMTANYNTWPSSSKFILFLLMFIGACAGSTAGGIKVSRLLILLKNGLIGLKQILHPNAVYNIRINNKTIPKQIGNNALQFFFLYLLIFILAASYMAFLGYDFPEAMGSVVTALSNVGPAFGSLGPVENYADVPVTGKMLLCFLMLLGRLELFPVLIMFLPEFWHLNHKARINQR